MSDRNLILVGGGGHCHSVIDIITSEGKWNIAGILDRQENVGHTTAGIPIIGTDSMIRELVRSGHRFIITCGQIKSADLRMRLADEVRSAGGECVNVIASTAHIADNVQMDNGISIGHFALLNSGSRIGRDCIINNGSLVEHDCTIGPNCHISTGAIINGGCVIGDRCFVGSGSTIIQGITIGEDCIIGAGSLILRDVKKGSLIKGKYS